MSDQIRPEDAADSPRRKRSDEVREDPPDEERPRRERRRRDVEDEDDPDRFRQRDAIETLIPYRNALALISYYLGVFALIPCAGLVLGPAALILGFLGLNYRKKHPTSGGTAHAIVGIVLGSLVLLGHLVALVVIVVLANKK
jgi:hypothetical protein